jgi:hypothetical protein
MVRLFDMFDYLEYSLEALSTFFTNFLYIGDWVLFLEEIKEPTSESRAIFAKYLPLVADKFIFSLKLFMRNLKATTPEVYHNYVVNPVPQLSVGLEAPEVISENVWRFMLDKRTIGRFGFADFSNEMVDILLALDQVSCEEAIEAMEYNVKKQKKYPPVNSLK